MRVWFLFSCVEIWSASSAGGIGEESINNNNSDSDENGGEATPDEKKMNCSQKGRGKGREKV